MNRRRYINTVGSHNTPYRYSDLKNTRVPPRSDAPKNGFNVPISTTKRHTSNVPVSHKIVGPDTSLKYGLTDFSGYTSKDLRSWSIVHMNAKLATDRRGLRLFVDYIRYLSKYFPCGKCRPHIKDYLYNFPPERAFDIDNETGCFKWSVEFHNSVNKRLHKPEVSYHDAYTAYYS